MTDTDPSAQSTRSLRAVLFSDMRGYSALMSADEERALRLLEEHDRIITPLVEIHRGRLIKKIGDALMVSFASGGDAVDCAVDVQEALSRHNEGKAEGDQIIIRIGIHVGEVVEREGDLFGHGVNLAARLEPLAPPGGIAVSETVVSLLKARPKFAFRAAGEHQVKNIDDPVAVYLVGAAEDPSDASSQSAPSGAKRSASPVPKGAMDEARASVRPIALSLIGIGLLNWIVLIITIVYLAIVQPSSQTLPMPSLVELELALKWVFPLSFVASFVVLMGAYQMLYLRKRRLAVASCVVIMLASPGNIIGLPIAVWGLAVLMRPDIVRAFAQTKTQDES